MCACLCPTYWTTFGIAQKNRNGSCPQHEWDHSQFFEFLTPPPPPTGANGSHRGRGHVGRHCPYTNGVDPCTRCRDIAQKTAKMQKFPIDSHSNENFICPFFRPPGPPTTKLPRSRSWCLLYPEPKFHADRTILRWDILNRTNKQTNKSKLNITPNATLYGEIIIW